MATAEDYAAWIVKNADKKGSQEFEIVASAYQDALKNKRPSPTEQSYKATDGMSKFDLAAAGLGKSVYDAGRGLGQLTGLVSRDDVDSANAIDKDLMSTGWGKAGKIGGDILSILVPGAAAAKYGSQVPKVGKAISTLGEWVTKPKGVLPSLAGGGIIGATQPVGTEDSRINNIALNAGIGAAVPILATGAGIGKTLLSDMWRKSGQEAMAGGVLERMSSAPDDIISRIDSAQPIFPGYQNTLPESLVGDSGIATFAHTQASKDPFAVGTKTKLNTKSQELTNRILDTFHEQAGSPEKRRALQDEIDAATSQLYEQGRNQQIPITPDLASLFDRPVINQAAQYKQGSLANRGMDFSSDLQYLLDKPMYETQARTVSGINRSPVSYAGEQGYANTTKPFQVETGGGQNLFSKYDPVSMTAKPRTVTGADLQGVKIGVNDLRNKEISDMASSKLKDRIGSMDQAKADLSKFLPDELKQADAAYSELAKKQAQMNVFDALLNMQSPILKDTGFGTIYANKLFRSLDDNQLAKLSTGWDRTKSLSDVLTPEQMQIIEQAEKALQTQSIISKQGAAKGSPTGQNETGRQVMSSLVRGLGLPSWIPDNALAQSLVETPLSRTLFRIPEANIQQIIADSLVDPAYAKEVLTKYRAKQAPTRISDLLDRQFIPAIGAASYISQ